MTWTSTLRSALLASGKSVHAIAKEAGVPQPTVHRFVCDGAEPKLGTAEKLAAVVGLKLCKGGHGAKAR